MLVEPTAEKSSQPRITPRARRPRPAPLPQDPADTPEKACADQVRRLRIERGWSQAELAARVAGSLPKWAQTTVAKTEAGTRPVRVNEAAALASALGVSLAELLHQQREVSTLKVEEDIQRLLLEHATLAARESELQRQWDHLDHELQQVQGRLHEVAGEFQEAVKALQAHQKDK